MKRRICLLIPFLCLAATCLAARPYPAARIERLDPALDRLLSPDARLEELADGVTWAEGPVWYQGGIVFSDVPRNVMYRWQPGWENKEVFLKPSGQLTPAPGFREPGSNGLALDREGRLLVCQCGERRIARYDGGKFTPVADRYDGKRFNSPNDLVVRRDGSIYFTDPPYGLDGVEQSPLIELPWAGVYRVGEGGRVALLCRTIRFANGIAFSPDERTLYVGSTEDGNAHIEAFDVQPDGTLANERLFFDARPLARSGLPGGCDGMKVDREGNVWTTGPGGLLIVTPAGKLLGRILMGVPTANCNWGDDGGTLYITASQFLLRVRTRTRGSGW
jgi:gluconolactonase